MDGKITATLVNEAVIKKTKLRTGVHLECKYVVKFVLNFV